MPGEVESALFTHPAVADAAVAAIPHPVLGEDVAAWVVLRSDATASAESLRAFLLERLADYKVPRRYTFVDALPRNEAGQGRQGPAGAWTITRRALRERRIRHAPRGGDRPYQAHHAEPARTSQPAHPPQHARDPACRRVGAGRPAGPRGDHQEQRPLLLVGLRLRGRGRRGGRLRPGWIHRGRRHAP